MRFIFLFFFLPFTYSLLAQDAVILANTYLFHSASDSDSLPARVLTPGTALRVTGVNSEAYILDHDERIFHWFHVEDIQGRDGWVRGYDVATVFGASQLPEHLAKYDGTQINYPRDFGLTNVWFAGTGTVAEKSDDGSTFREYYLVFCNESWKTLTKPVGMQSGLGYSETVEMYVQDVNLDGKQDFVTLKRSKPEIGELAYQLEIFTITRGMMEFMVDAPITLNTINREIAPMHASCVEIEEDQIRFEAITYRTCTESAAQYGCLAFETKTLKWSPASQKYQNLYEPTVTVLKARIKPLASTTRMYASADKWSSTVTQLQKGTEVLVKCDKTQYSTDTGKKVRTNWFLVETKDGRAGYVDGREIYWYLAKHDALLHQWFDDPSLTIYDFVPKYKWIEIR
jgi:hypothetical protein